MSTHEAGDDTTTDGGERKSKSSSGLTLLVYDRTCPGPRRWGVRWPGLSDAWRAGDTWFRGVTRRFDASVAIDNWSFALEWLTTIRPGTPIREIQYWGHGLWGRVLAGTDILSPEALQPRHRDFDALCRIRGRLVGPDALWWFRTCETFGASKGHHFARAWTDFFQCRAAGHTYVIGFFQSGLHSLAPGQPISWPASEGLATPTATGAMNSGPAEPNTITCLQSRLPRGW